jgi:glycosyltransferase involved in cell wall biosynthesis
MSSPKFSVLVPTRNRPVTLAHTLRTCLDQDFDSYEVIVSDDGTNPATAAIVEPLLCSRLRYHCAARSLTMAENWEHAFSFAQGEFILVVGDDDGLMPGGLSDLNRLLDAFQCPALRFERVNYHWPNTPLFEGENVISFPLIREVEWRESAGVIEGVANSELDFTLLPSPYTGVVRRDVLERMRERAGGVFRGSSPDVYSGYAIAHYVERYPVTTCVISVAGTAAGSNGAEALHLGGNNPGSRSFRSRNQEIDYLRCHPKAPDVFSLAAVLADMFLRAKDDHFPDDSSIVLDRISLARNSLREVRWETRDQWESAVGAIERSLGDVPDLRSRFRQGLPTTPLPPAQVSYGASGFNGYRLSFDASRFGVEDVYGAAGLADRILRPSRGPLPLPVLREKLSPYRRLRGAARILLKGR